MEALRGKARQFAVTNLPKAASVTENAGQALSDFALSTSRSLARTLRAQEKRSRVSSRGTALLSLTPLLRTAGRFAMRNPTLLATAGVAVAMLGYAAWRKREAATA